MSATLRARGIWHTAAETPAPHDATARNEQCGAVTRSHNERSPALTGVGIGAQPMSHASPLISVAHLAELRESEPRLVILDVQWTLGRTDGYKDFLAAHIDGARF